MKQATQVDAQIDCAAQATIQALRKCLSATAAVFAVVLALAGPVSAVPIVDQVLGAPTNIKVGTPLSFTHDFTNNAAPNNYAAGVDSIASALLTITLTDDNGNESYTISFGTAQQLSTYTLNNIAGNRDFDFSVLAPSLADLSATGMLDVTISATGCNGSACGNYAFKFVSSTLTVDATRGNQGPSIRAPSGVPEPGTLALLGLGLAGLAAARRRRQ